MYQNESNQDTDTLLLQLLEEGDLRAFDALFEKYWQKTYSEAYKRIKNHDEAKDIVQDIFTHIWFNRKTIRIQNLPAYLNVAVRNKVLKLLAKQKVTHPFFDILENIPEETVGADSGLLWKEFCKSYDALIQTLPPKRQQIFRLRFQEDLRTREIAAQLEITVKTVQNQLGKAIDTLRGLLMRIFSIITILLSY